MNESVAIVVFSEDKTKILLTKRRDVPVWVLPGGGIDLGETPSHAAIRETKEETGFDVKIIKKIGEYTPINRLSCFTHLYECEIVQGIATIGEETKEIHFFSLDHLPRLLPPPYDLWIEDAKAFKKTLIKKTLYTITYRKFLFHFLRHPILVFRFILSKMGFPINT